MPEFTDLFNLLSKDEIVQNGLLALMESSEVKNPAPVDVEVVRSHLKAQGSGVNLDLNAMPGRPGKHEFFRVDLDESDTARLVLYWEFQKHTLSGSCQLSSLLPSAAKLPRVRSFVAGDSARGFDRLDLSVAQSMEPVLVTDGMRSDFLYVIDGNHRVIAHHLRQLSFEGVSAFVCVHAEMRKWAYIPEYFKKLWKPQQ